MSKMIKCNACGAEIAKSAKSCPGCGAKNKKPIYKRWWLWAVVAIIAVGAISGGGDKNEPAAPTNAGVSDTSANAQSTVSQPPANSAHVDEGPIGDYYVAIKDAKTAIEKYGDKEIVIITYEWTNNSDEPAAFWISLTAKAYQNGIECESAIAELTESEDGWMKEIKPGVTLEFKRGYILNDLTSDVEIEVRESISFANDPPKVTKTFRF